MKHTDAGLRKKRISLLRDIVMHIAPITIRNRLKRANMAAATFRSAQRETTALFLCSLTISQVLFRDNSEHSRFTDIYGSVIRARKLA